MHNFIHACTTLWLYMAWCVTWNQTILSTQFQITLQIFSINPYLKYELQHHFVDRSSLQPQPTEVWKTPTCFGPIGNATLNLWTCCWQAVLMFNMEEQTMSEVEQFQTQLTHRTLRTTYTQGNISTTSRYYSRAVWSVGVCWHFSQGCPLGTVSTEWPMQTSLC